MSRVKPLTIVCADYAELSRLVEEYRYIGRDVRPNYRDLTLRVLTR